jgi:membrane protease YdiL (CAAX protease family)
MNGLLTAWLLGALCTASLLAWGHLLQVALHRGEPVFPLREACPPPIPRRALGLGGLCLLLFLADPVIDLANHLLGKLPPSPPEPELAAVQMQCALNLVLTAVLLAMLGSGPSTLGAQGVFWRPLGRQVWDAVLGFHLAIGPVFLVLVASELVQLRGADPEHQLLKMLVADGSAANWFWISLTAVVAAPLLEELLFRMLLQGALQQVLSPVVAIAISSLLFCLVHRFPDSVALLPLAAVLGYIRYRRGSYLTLALIHAAFNAVNLLLTALASHPPP